MHSPVVIATYSFPHEAHMARSCLESSGIPAYVVDEHTVSMQWLYSNAIGGVRLLVSSEHEREACEILNSDFSIQIDEEFGEEEYVCPQCGSKHVQPYTKGKRPAFLTFLLIGFPLFFYQRGLKCDDCGKFWKE